MVVTGIRVVEVEEVECEASSLLEHGQLLRNNAIDVGMF